jgi:hypothetical protein
MLVSENVMAPPEEDEMHPVLTQQLAAQHIVELRQQAATQRLIRELRAGPGRATRHRRAVWERVLFWPPRPARA